MRDDIRSSLPRPSPFVLLANYASLHTSSVSEWHASKKTKKTTNKKPRGDARNHRHGTCIVYRFVKKRDGTHSGCAVWYVFVLHRLST